MKKIIGLLAISFILPSIAMSMEIYKKDNISLSAGWWGQAWFQYVSDMDTDDDGAYDDHLKDFLVRRSYFLSERHRHPRTELLCSLCRGQTGDG